MAKKSPLKATKKAARSRAPLTKRDARLLEGAMAGAFAFVIGSVFLMSSLQSFFMQTNQFAAVVSSVLVDLANTDRAAYNLQQLTVNPLLVAAAQAKADDMAAKSYFAHTSPEGLDSWHWFTQVGYNFQNAGENLAVDFSDSADVERAWMNSPSHRDNILNGKYTEIGIATAAGMYQGRQTTFVVQMFGSPRAGSAQLAKKEPAFQTVPLNPTEIATASNDTPVLGEQTEVPAIQTTPVKKPSKTVAQAPAAQVDEPSVQPVVADVQTQTQPVGAIVRHSNDWQVLATSPSTTLQYSYYLLAILVLLALAIDTGLEIKWHHRKRAATAGAMMAVMLGLFVFADYALFKSATVALSNGEISHTL
jgi:uncharacterized protein YkwD